MNFRILGALLAVVVAALLFVTGAGEVAWHNLVAVKEAPVQGDPPWGAPGQQAKFYLKASQGYTTGLVRSPEWGMSPRRTTQPFPEVDAAFSFLEGTRAPHAWPATQKLEDLQYYSNVVFPDYGDGGADGPPDYMTRVAPYDFVIVSIRPMIVLMIPAPELPGFWAERRAAAERGDYSANTAWDARYASADVVPLSTRWLENPIACGTSLPAKDGLLWFSPDLKQAPAPPGTDADGRPEIRWPEGAIRFEKDGDRWKTERTR